MEGRPDGRMERHEPNQLRISDEDRHRVAEILRHAAGEGRIDFDELDERLEAAYSAKTYADLVPITADLPAHASAQPAVPMTRRPTSPVPASSFGSSVAVMSETKRKGVWLVPDQHTAFALMGSVQLDLREAQFAGRDVTINANAIMGDVTILVNAQTQVLVDGIAIMADFSESRAKVPAEVTPDSQVVRIKGFALMASVSVQRRPLPGETRKRLGLQR
ncbi:MAG TPA: DUF1707 domain-containing protein [Nocardioidaceae bacterium]|nr:DUF1707 domain-containing protein [Nocardioidaceae bacterium]